MPGTLETPHSCQLVLRPEACGTHIGPSHVLRTTQPGPFLRATHTADPPVGFSCLHRTLLT